MSIRFALAFMGLIAYTNARAEPQLSPERASQIKLLFDLSRGEETALRQLDDAARSRIDQLPAGERGKFFEATHKDTQGKVAELVTMTAPVYERHFTAEEIGAIAQFLNSPAGQKLLRAQKMIAQDLSPIYGFWVNRQLERASSGGSQSQAQAAPAVQGRPRVDVGGAPRKLKKASELTDDEKQLFDTYLKSASQAFTKNELDRALFEVRRVLAVTDDYGDAPMLERKILEARSKTGMVNVKGK